MAINLSKKQELNTDPKAMQEINFTENLEEDGNTTFFFHSDNWKNIVNVVVRLSYSAFCNFVLL